MNNTTSGPVEIWLRRDSLQVICCIVNEDESTYGRPVDSLSMRGAQREIGGYLIAGGLWPDGLWTVEATDDNGAAIEAWRRFTPPA